MSTIPRRIAQLALRTTIQVLQGLQSVPTFRMPYSGDANIGKSDRSKGDRARFIGLLVVTQVVIGLIRNSAIERHHAHPANSLQQTETPGSAVQHSAALVVEEFLKVIISAILLFRSKDSARSGSASTNTHAAVTREASDLDDEEKASLLHRSPRPKFHTHHARRRSSISRSTSRPRPSPNGQEYHDLPNSANAAVNFVYPPEPSRGHAKRPSRSSIPPEALEDLAEEPLTPAWRMVDSKTSNTPSRRQLMMLLGLAAMYALRDHATLMTSRIADDQTIHILGLSIVLLVGIQTQLFQHKLIDSQRWTSALLLISALFIAQDYLFPGYPHTTFALLLALNWLSSIALLITDFVYKHNEGVSIHMLNLVICSITFLVSIAIYFIYPYEGSLLDASDIPPAVPYWDFKSAITIFLRAAADIIAFFVLKYSSAFTYCIASLLSATIVFPLSFTLPQQNGAPTISTFQIISSAVGIFAAWSYLNSATASEPTLSGTSSPTSELPRSRSPEPSGRWITRLPSIIFVAALGCPLAYIISASPLVLLPRDVPSGESILQHSESLDYFFAPPPLPLEPLAVVECKRRPLPPSSAYTGKGERSYHAFDDVLVVVFFSHARYDVNLDNYREAYSEYFPNILFIGPASREDKGFNHSYDVVVDSYQSDEDLTGWYKMAGRMAHHMLYTAMKDHPCYSGYLWAPFDAFLNVPRLQQFDQSKIWYHSPFGEYVPNPATDDYVGEDGKPLHPPSANVSNQTRAEYVKNYHAWGSNDGWNWWWGEPHVGLDVCWPAYERVPKHRRDRLEDLTGEPERFIGGSADTVYIPGNLREPFLETLGLFLETDCFLEIAVPTALHLVLPPDQTIQFVDHWWIWEHPLNTTFIRNMWDRGYEVDSFHTFHWGDKQADGVWKADEDGVQDVRAVLEDSFLRQGIEKSP